MARQLSIYVGLVPADSEQWAAGGNQWVRRFNFVELWSDMCEVSPTGSAGDAQVGQDYTTWWILSCRLLEIEDLYCKPGHLYAGEPG